MTKIRHGKYILTPQQAENRLDEFAKAKDDLANFKTFVNKWVKTQLDNHNPYVSAQHGVDLSISYTDNLMDTLLEKLGSDLWCNHCRNPWPCRTLRDLRVLKDALYSTYDLTKAYEALEAAERPENRPNTIQVRL